LQEILESFTFEVSQAASGEEGLAEIEKASPDHPFELVVMDWKMPGMDGMQTTRFMRTHSQAELSQVIVIGLTANTNALDRERCMQSGMNAVLTKPIDIQRVKETVEVLLTRPLGAQL
jgi:CheY-like chemotaxis protein